MIDKDLFLHDLSVVAIMKCEGPYLNEWLDYHLLAGVDHFYIYDNDSPDNQAEIAKPYVEAGLVTYIPFPGKAMQMPAYNDAVKKFKFQSRYLAFIDGDEFIFPKLTGGGRIIDVVDEVLSRDPNAAGLAINWYIFGSNGQETADYSRGVLERFTHRAPSDFEVNKHVKTIANPRKVNFMLNPHFPYYFEGFRSINENGNIVAGPFNEPVTVDKIVINHYHCKSWEEYQVKHYRGYAPCLIFNEQHYSQELFESHDRNEVFDDGILKYREARAKVYQPPDTSHVEERMLSALERNLSQQTNDLETLLTCRAVSTYLKAKSFEEASLKAIIRAFNSPVEVADNELFSQELSELSKLPYPVFG